MDVASHPGSTSRSCRLAKATCIPGSPPFTFHTGELNPTFDADSHTTPVLKQREIPFHLRTLLANVRTPPFGRSPLLQLHILSLFNLRIRFLFCIINCAFGVTHVRSLCCSREERDHASQAPNRKSCLPTTESGSKPKAAIAAGWFASSKAMSGMESELTQTTPPPVTVIHTSVSTCRTQTNGRSFSLKPDLTTLIQSTGQRKNVECLEQTVNLANNIYINCKDHGFSVLRRICVHRNRCSACWATIGIGAQPIAGEHSYRTISRTTVFGDQNLCPWESVLSLGCDHIGIGAQPRVRPWESVLSLLPDHTNQCVVRGRTH